MLRNKVKGGGIMEKGDSYHDIPNYIRHWISDGPQGHKIIILTDTGKMEFNCKWRDRKREASGRVSANEPTLKGFN